MIAPRATFRAFVRGRRSRTLYAPDAPPLSDVLRQSVGELSRTLELELAPPRAPRSAEDLLRFSGWALLSLLLTLALPLGALLFSLAMLSAPPAQRSTRSVRRSGSTA